MVKEKEGLKNARKAVSSGRAGLSAQNEQQGLIGTDCKEKIDAGAVHVRGRKVIKRRKRAALRRRDMTVRRNLSNAKRVFLSPRSGITKWISSLKTR